MLKKYIKIAIRNLNRNKVFSAINIVGLALGLATCLLILIYVVDELGYDRYNKNYDRIYRIDADLSFGGAEVNQVMVPDGLGPTMKKEFPEVSQYVRFQGSDEINVKKGNESIKEDRVVFADSTIFEVFTLPMLQGNPATALVDPNSMVITASTAKKYFNTVNVVGKTLTVINSTQLWEHRNEPGNGTRWLGVNYKISGVIKDFPSQSHFNFDFILPMSANQGSRQNNWIHHDYYTYLLLKKGADPKNLSSQFPSIIQKYTGPQIQQALNMSLQDLQKTGAFIKYSLMPLGSIHLRSHKMGEWGPNGHMEYVYIFSTIAMFILLIACINFMNLSTARSSKRAREVGIRKVLGSLRMNLITQFISESVLISFISLIIALFIAALLLPYFNELANKNMTLGILFNPWMILILFSLVIIVGIMAGSYPAFLLSAYQPIQVLKGKLSSGFKSGWLRNSLVVFQFGISITLIIVTLVIFSQLHYIRKKDLGFNRNQVLILNNCNALGQRAQAFKLNISQIAGVQSVTMSGFLPTGDNRMENDLFKDPTLSPSGALQLEEWSVDNNYIPTLEMKIISGRNFSPQFPSDSNGVILNESAIKMLGIQNPVGKKLYAKTDLETFSKGQKTITIIGVIKDFNFNSLRQLVTPVGFILGEDRGSMALRINSSDIPNLIGKIEQHWKSIVPGQPFSYSFMDEDFNKIYQSEQRIEKLFISFAVLAILVACLGLFGLITFAAEQQVKMIGIRKTLGASVKDIIVLLSGDFLKMVFVSILIASPVAWWITTKWLQGFAYKIHMSVWFLVAAGVLATLIALITVCSQAFKAAIANPVKSLRTE